MTPAYDAESLIDAQLVADLLTDSGIVAHVFGAALAGAVGELPPGSLVRVWIEDDARLDDARAIIQDWSSATVPDEDELERLSQSTLAAQGQLLA